MRRALIVVDVQRDFLPGGALGVDEGFDIIPTIVEMHHSGDYCLTITTGDAHPEKTEHFEKWPVHCVAGTEGAILHPSIQRISFHHVAKGMSFKDDGYSGFEGELRVVAHGGGSTVFDLDELLRVFKIDEVTVVGLALDYCVKATALDAVKAGYPTTVPLEATRPVAGETGQEAVNEMLVAGVDVQGNITTRAKQ